ncbi:MAG TPA: PEP-CTERM sorting domain-containing protein [Rhodocyclaceae bacterium]|nr:PEP-CTERM sorting domain-containing protein [Rhodocyclaceae bacterium]
MRIRKFIAAGALLFAGLGTAQASLSWVWDLEDWAPVVHQSDTITLHATLYNTTLSNENITADSLVSWVFDSAGDLPYTFSYPDSDFRKQFTGLNLAPGELFSFIFGYYTPNPAPVPIGNYSGDAFAIVLQDAAGLESSWSPDHQYRLTVVADESEPTTEVPEPASLALVATGLAGVWCCRRKRASSAVMDA